MILKQKYSKEKAEQFLKLQLKPYYTSIINDLTKNGIQFKTRIFNWIQWRSIYMLDPEMNVVELVCYDSTIEKK